MNIKIKLLELNKKQVDLLDEIHKRGYPTLAPSVLSRYINGREITTQAKEIAYEMWDIDVADLERRRNKLKTLELSAQLYSINHVKGAEQVELKQIFEAIDHMSEQMTEFDDEAVRAVVERIDVIS